MDKEHMEVIATIVKAIAWPITALALVMLLRSAIGKAIARIKGIEGPGGWKFCFQMRKISNQLKNCLPAPKISTT